ncbi:alpha/beta hydrolase [uncultured Parabacteroides sp.]|uniref:alpha/beta hydrolase n=1 Tax=uncultured Parabacteroides sp. TaxID=512312 RepID=UPI00261CAF67|nr:alpha/beta hydrolase [uncultured Parabacteroides sp.]
MRSFLLLFLSLFTSVIWAQNIEQSKLWPDKPNANEAEIYIYQPKKSDKAVPAVLICPGGGYSGLAMDREGHDMAKWYASNGFVAVVLKYRMPKGIHSVPLEDAEKAISVIRENADKWNLDKNKVGIVGSSAGGHLAASLCTIAKDANRPNFAILYYPVISFDSKMAHKGSMKNLLGKDIDNKKLVDHYSLDKQVDDKTPKTLLLLSDDDRVVPPMNSILYYMALNEHHIPASLYMFPNGGHGWGIRYDFGYYQEVKDLILKWLRRMQIID